MGFTEAVKTCFNKYITIEGRARRSEYWWFILFGFLGSLVASILDTIIFGAENTVLSGLFSLGILLPGICVAVRRLHDRDMSGWWLLLYLVPLIGALVLLVIFALPGTDGPNRFGPSPLGRTKDDDDESDGGYSMSSIPRAGRE